MPVDILMNRMIYALFILDTAWNSVHNIVKKGQDVNYGGQQWPGQ